MRVDSEVPVSGAGHQEWLLELPREGVFADLAKQLPNAKEFYLRPDGGGPEKISIPMNLSLYDLRLHMADGYHVYAEVHPVEFWLAVDGGPGRAMRVAPSASVREVLQQHCVPSVSVDDDANYVFPTASVSLLQGLGMGTQAAPLQLKDSRRGKGRRSSFRRSSLWRSLSKHASFDSLGSRLGSLASTLSGLRGSGQRPEEPVPAQQP